MVSRFSLSATNFSAVFLFLSLAYNPEPTEPASITPAIVQPTGPASARRAPPALIPPQPAAKAPPPSHANAALVAAAPDKVEIAVPVDATPKVVAIPIAAVGPIVATATPRALNVAPAPEPPAATFASTSALLISYCLVLKFSSSTSIF